jgi:RND family efflux transporter MFP subunit
MKAIKITSYIAVLTLATAVFIGCGSSASGDKKEQLAKLKADYAELAKKISALEKEIAASTPDSLRNIKAKEVVATTVAVRPFDHYLQTQGRVESEENILVSAKSMGIITQVYVREGQMVSKGQVLAQIDNSIIVKNLEAMRAQMELAKTVFERQQNLWNQKIGTEVQYLQAKTNKESLEKQLASLEEQNDMARIKAPIAGTIDDLMVKIGENIAPGMPAARLVNTANLKLSANVSEAYVTNIKVGNRAIVMIPELKRDVEARVTFVGKTIDPLSRTFAVEVALPSFTDVRPNMSGVVKIVYHSEPKALAVPVNVVQTVNGEKIVYVAEQQGANTVARKRVVQVAGVFDNLAQLLQGISEGDKVITFGYQGLSDGQVIKL